MENNLTPQEWQALVAMPGRTRWRIAHHLQRAINRYCHLDSPGFDKYYDFITDFDQYFDKEGDCSVDAREQLSSRQAMYCFREAALSRLVNTRGEKHAARAAAAMGSGREVILNVLIRQAAHRSRSAGVAHHQAGGY